MRLNEIDNTGKINKLLKKYFEITGEYSIVNGRVDVDGECKLTAKCIKLPVKFNKVSGNFNCSSNQLTTLEGGPISVSGDFDCTSNRLTSLQGAPTSVSGSFYCNHNQLISLQGAPQSVGRYFECSDNKLTSLEGAPISVGKDFDCCFNKLTSLEGGPTSVSGDFDCNSNKLTSLQGGPTSIGGSFYCAGNKLTTLESAPQSVGRDFHCEYDSSLPLLRLLFIKNLKSIAINNAPEDVVNYLNKYIGKGPGGALACAAELIKAGFRGNARR